MPRRGMDASCPPGAREVSLTELDGRASDVIGRVRAGEIAVVSKHGRPVAMIVPLADSRTLAPVDVGGDPALRELAERLERRQFDREWSALLHGRWYGARAPAGRGRR